MDSYDYGAAPVCIYQHMMGCKLTVCCGVLCVLQVVPVVASKKVEAGGFWVLRPDSGDPVEVVLQVSQLVCPWSVMLCVAFSAQ
jgi:hypothetical protein